MTIEIVDREDISQDIDRVVKQELIELSEEVDLSEDYYDNDEYLTKYYKVSSVKGMVGDPAFAAMNSMAGNGFTSRVDETMVFPADREGESLGIGSHDVVVCEPHDHEKAVEKLVEKANEGSSESDKSLTVEAREQLSDLIQFYRKELVQEARSFAEMKDHDQVEREDLLNAVGSRRKQIVEEESEVNQ